LFAAPLITFPENFMKILSEVFAQQTDYIMLLGGGNKEENLKIKKICSEETVR